jgi:hypothetical protein
LFYPSKSLDEITLALQKFLFEKKKRDLISIESAIFPIIKGLIKRDGMRLLYAKIWNNVIDKVPGNVDPKNPNAFYTTEYGRLNRNTLSQLIEDKFGSGRERGNAGSIIIFDKNKLSRFDGLYESQDFKIVVKPKMSVNSVGSVSSPESDGLNFKEIGINKNNQNLNSKDNTTTITTSTTTNNNNNSIENEYSKNIINNTTDTITPTQPTQPTLIQKSCPPLYRLLEYKDHSNCISNNHQSANSDFRTIQLSKCPQCDYSTKNCEEDIAVHLLNKHMDWINTLQIEAHNIDNKIDKVIKLFKGGKLIDLVGEK